MKQQKQHQLIFSKPAINLYGMEWFKSKGSSNSKLKNVHRQRYSVDQRFDSLLSPTTKLTRNRELSPSVSLISTQSPLFNKNRSMSQCSQKSFSFAGSSIKEAIEERKTEKSRTRCMISNVTFDYPVCQRHRRLHQVF